MSKIIQVINVMISNSSKISKIIAGQSEQLEFFFLYDNKHKWSISLGDNDVYYLHYYPGKETIEQLASIDQVGWIHYNQLITYSSKKLKEREAYESLLELYRLIKEKSFDADGAFDDIIKSDETF